MLSALKSICFSAISFDSIFTYAWIPQLRFSRHFPCGVLPQFKKQGPVVDSKKNTLVLRGEVPIFAANKNAHSICLIVWFISCIISRARWMWCEFKSALGCTFRSFWFLNQRRCDTQRGLSSRYQGYSNCIMLRCVHYVRLIWHAWYVRIWLSVLILNHVAKIFQFTKQQYFIRLWLEQSLYDLKTYYFMTLSGSSPLCTQYTQTKHNFIL